MIPTGLPAPRSIPRQKLCRYIPAYSAGRHVIHDLQTGAEHPASMDGAREARREAARMNEREDRPTR